MSWWVYLKNKRGKLVEVERFVEGGTYALGGETEASLNITYNYSSLYRKYLHQEQGLRYLDGRQGFEVIPVLAQAVKALGVERSRDYWEVTEGNAGYALSILLKWAKKHPSATFSIS